MVLREAEPAEAGVQEARELMLRLFAEPPPLAECAYLDLFAESDLQ